MTDPSRTGRPDARTPRSGGPRSDRTDRRSDDGRPAEREHTAELPKLSDFTRKQFQQELMFRKGEIDNGIPELAGFHTDMIQSMLATYRPIVLDRTDEGDDFEFVPRRRPLIDPDQGNGRTDIMDVDRGETYRAGRVLLLEGLADKGLTPVVTQDGLVLFFIYADLCDTMGDRRFRAIFPMLEYKENDGRGLYVDLTDEDDDEIPTRRTSGSRLPRSPRNTGSPRSEHQARRITKFVMLAILLVIATSIGWHFLAMAISVHGILSFLGYLGCWAVSGLSMFYKYLGDPTIPGSGSRRTNR